MLGKVRSILDKGPSALVLWALSVVTFVISKVIQTQWLDKSYVESRFPVPFYEGQTTFDASETKAHFQVLLDQGTLDIFWRTQLIDFIYIFSTFVFTVIVMAAIYKMLAFSTSLQKFSWLMLLLMPLNAIMDVLENLVSFVMLAEPTGFADWLIVPYSSFAVAKFAFYLTGYIWIAVAVLIKLTHSIKAGHLPPANQTGAA
jgi:hypothetical protein